MEKIFFNSSIKKEQHFTELYIIILYFAYLLRTLGAYSLLPSKIDSLLFGFIGLLGGILLLRDFIQIVFQNKRPGYNIWLFLFLVSVFVTTAINYQYSFLGNVKVIIWQAIYLLFIYKYFNSGSASNWIKTAFKWTMIIFAFISSLISIIMFIMQYQYISPLTIRQNPLRIGFVENRLFGAYIDPNYAGVMAVIVIIFSIYLLYVVSKSVMSKAFLGLNIFVQLSYIALSGSRNAQIVLFLVATIGLMLFLFKTSHHFVIINNNFLRSIVIIVISCLFGILSLGSLQLLKTGYSAVPAAIGTVNNIQNNNHKSEHQKDNDPELDDEVSLERKDVEESKDVSNLRFTIWKNALEIFKKNMFFGMAIKSIHEYAINEMPNNYLAKTKLAVHSAYINLLVSTGIIGTTLMIIFVLQELTQCFRVIFSKRILSFEYITYFLTVLALAVSGLFQNEIFLMATSSALVFWICLAEIDYFDNKSLKE